MQFSKLFVCYCCGRHWCCVFACRQYHEAGTGHGTARLWCCERIWQIKWQTRMLREIAMTKTWAGELLQTWSMADPTMVKMDGIRIWKQNHQVWLRAATTCLSKVTRVNLIIAPLLHPIIIVKLNSKWIRQIIPISIKIYHCEKDGMVDESVCFTFQSKVWNHLLHIFDMCTLQNHVIAENLCHSVKRWIVVCYLKLFYTHVAL